MRDKQNWQRRGRADGTVGTVADRSSLRPRAALWKFHKMSDAIIATNTLLPKQAPL
jgi:hypothetical protein